MWPGVKAQSSGSDPLVPQQWVAIQEQEMHLDSPRGAGAWDPLDRTQSSLC